MKIIDGKIVVFKSTKEFFNNERDGEKPNTQRLLTKKEYEQLIYEQPPYINIRSIETHKHFMRKITNVCKTGDILGFVQVTISWKHEVK